MTGSSLRHDLVSNCGNWPDQEWAPDNKVSLGVLEAGAPAVDFTLRDLAGTPHTLSELLATRPVLLLLGAFT